MKKIILCAILLSIVILTFSQQSNPSQFLTNRDYLKKSRHQKSAATLLVSTGVLCAGLGIWGGALTPDSDGHNSGGIFFFVTGITAIGGSIPLFIASGRNKRKGRAMSAFIKMENTDMIHRYSLLPTLYPALSIKINLR